MPAVFTGSEEILSANICWQRVRIRNLDRWRCWSTHFDDVIRIVRNVLELSQDACVVKCRFIVDLGQRCWFKLPVFTVFVCIFVYDSH